MLRISSVPSPLTQIFQFSTLNFKLQRINLLPTIFLSSSCHLLVMFLSSSNLKKNQSAEMTSTDWYKEGFSVLGNRRIRKTHALIASARRNHVVDGNTLVGIVNQRHREVSIRSVANSAVVAPRQCDLTLVIQQLNVQRQLETTLRHHHLRVINAKIRRNFIGFRNAIAKANFPRCANCFGLRASFTLGAIPLFLAKCYPCSFVSSVGNIFLPRISQIFIDLAETSVIGFFLPPWRNRVKKFYWRSG